MSDPLPARVRKFLENVTDNPCSALASEASDVLAEYPKPAPVWQPGDVVLSDGMAWLFSTKAVWWAPNGRVRADAPVSDPEPLFAGGRRVHPACFHDHAETLRSLASCVLPSAWLHQAESLLAIADDIDPETPDA